jgi:imidazolonepropionase-like amidohydrolase
MTDVLHLTGPLLVGPDEVVGEAWVVGGRLTFARPSAAATTLDGWVLPGLVDAHCHVGLDAHGAVDDATSEAQALTEREAGVLLLRDAGSAADTRWIDDRDDLPVVIRAGRHIARPRRYIRNFGEEVEPADLVGHRRRQAGPRRRLGQAGGRLDRPGHRRPRAVLAARPAAPGDRGGARRGRPGDRALLLRELAGRPGRGRHRLHRARHRLDATRCRCWPSGAWRSCRR